MGQNYIAAMLVAWLMPIAIKIITFYQTYPRPILPVASKIAPLPLRPSVSMRELAKERELILTTNQTDIQPDTTKH